MAWTDEQLSKLPVIRGFRMRGESMTRLEVFSDAAFAFALTMLVVSVGGMPSNIEELILALKGAPAFALSFAQISVFWVAHRSWSRKYGLEDRVSTFLTLVMIFVVLIYVYPLRLIYSSFMGWITGFWLPSEFAVSTGQEIMTLFAIYGIGYAALTGVLALLSLRAFKLKDTLRLNAVETVYVRRGMAIWTMHMGVGICSTLYSLLLPPWLGIYGGFVYSSPVSCNHCWRGDMGRS